MTTFSLWGVLFALVFYAISVSPSLLPRRWWWHAFVSGTLTGLGYGLGVGVAALGSYLLQITGVQISAPEQTVLRGTQILVFVVVAWTLRSVVGSFIESKRAAALTGMKPVKLPEYLLGLVLSFGMLAVVLAALHLLVLIFSQIVLLLQNWVYQPVAALIAMLAVLLIIFIVSNKVVFKVLMAYFSYVAMRVNRKPSGTLKVPAVPERSGSAESFETWESIGGQGRLFLGLGPNAEEIAEVTRRPAMEPVRAYVGIDNPHPDLDKVAEEAVAELKRAGGLDRALLIVNTATGSGWVDQWVIQPVEYLTGGNCATISMQYSYLFSAALLVSDLEACARAGIALFEAVEKAVNELPEDRRPLVVVTGESLGAYGSQAPFADLEDLNRRTDGALWVGSPYDSRLSRIFTRKRHRGSAEVAPVYESGRNVRFVNNPQQLEADIFGRQFGSWEFPRSVFVQHASDPVVWYTTRLMIYEPDWLRERVGLDVSKSMRYTPFATYLQVLTDLPIAGLAPPGHGHTYHRELISAWIKVLGFDNEMAIGRIGSTGWVDKAMQERIGSAIERDHLKAERKTDIKRAERTQQGQG